MRTLRTKYLSNIPIQEDNYKVDFIILEKYQSFSSEILRLSLLGLTIYGFLVINVVLKTKDTSENFAMSVTSHKVVFMLGAISLLFAALLALGHRYFSTDCMTHFIRRFRLVQKLEDTKTGSEAKDHDTCNCNVENMIQHEELSFENDLRTCKWLLITSCIFFISGIFFIMAGLGASLDTVLPKP